MKDLITSMAKALADEPNQVAVTELVGGTAVIYELQVAKRDIGKVIGKRGRIVEAMRIILDAAAKKTNKRAMLEIVE